MTRDLFDDDDRLATVVACLKRDGPATARGIASACGLTDAVVRSLLILGVRRGLVRSKNRSDETRAYDARTGADRPRSAVIWWATYEQ